MNANIIFITNFQMLLLSQRHCRNWRNNCSNCKCHQRSSARIVKFYGNICLDCHCESRMFRFPTGTYQRQGYNSIWAIARVGSFVFMQLSFRFIWSNNRHMPAQRHMGIFWWWKYSHAYVCGCQPSWDIGYTSYIMQRCVCWIYQLWSRCNFRSVLASTRNG